MPWANPLKKDIAALERMDRAAIGSMQKGTDAGAEILATAVRAGARVDSGELVSAIGTQTYQPKGKDQKATRVTLGPFYRQYLEEGTVHMSAYPFIQPAYVATGSAIGKAVVKPIDDAIKKAVK